MIEIIGNFSLGGVVMAAVGAVMASIASARQESSSGTRIARWLLFSMFGLLTVAAIALLAALVTSDFRFVYVAGYTERALPIGYKAAAFWAGQEGSLLLWAWILAGLCAAAAWGWRTHVRASAPNFAVAHGVLAIIVGFFAVLLLFTANPFHLFEAGAPANGRGLNPQLQDIGMLIHPPLLFTGYAAYAIPFALLIGVLLHQPQDNRWLSAIRRWLLFSWLFMGAGIIVGAWWAYVELGWGGYWAWDPVENASLLPWLTGTAVIHSMLMQQHRGMFKRWNASLIAVTFFLCIFGTYLTRSGVIDSVHAFAPSLLGSFFLVFLAVGIALTLALIFWRWNSLAPEHELSGLISREGAFLASNVVLTIMMLATLVGTIFPLISGVFVTEPVTVKAAFYDRVVAPMAIVLVTLMAVAPVLAFGKQAASKIGRSLAVPATVSAAIVLASAIMVTHNPWALACIGIVALGTANVIVDFSRTISARRRSTGESWPLCAVLLIDRDHRRYGGQLTHLGVMLVVIGIAGSSLFSSENIHQLNPGQSIAMERYVLRLVSLDEVRHANFTAVQATVEVSEGHGENALITLKPQRRFYDAWVDQPNSEVAINSTWREDLYLSLAGWDDGGRTVALQVKVNPVVLWIWIGGMVMGVGCIYCMLPPLLPRLRVRAVESEARVRAEPGRHDVRELEAVGGIVATRAEVPA